VERSCAIYVQCILSFRSLLLYYPLPLTRLPRFPCAQTSIPLNRNLEEPPIQEESDEEPNTDNGGILPDKSLEINIASCFSVFCRFRAKRCGQVRHSYHVSTVLALPGKTNEKKRGQVRGRGNRWEKLEERQVTHGPNYLHAITDPPYSSS
jgi:hypothetical protein